MVNVHLNGDIVRCPDVSRIREEAKENRIRHKICIYNEHEDTCQVWQNSLKNWQDTKNNFNCSSCKLSQSKLCPGYQRQKEHGKKQKHFSIDGKRYRQLSSAAHYMVKESKHKTIFVTLTFPKFKIKPNEKQLNQCFSRFMDNLHNSKKYSVKYYIAIREYGSINGRIHYHLLCSIKFTSFVDLNNAWNSAISDFCEYSSNAFQSERKNVILYNPQKALRYICKYLSKTRGQKSESRIVFISRETLIKHKKESIDIIDILKGYKSIYIHQTSDFTTSFRITDTKEFNRFCNSYLYALFELSDNKTNFTGIK